MTDAPGRGQLLRLLGLGFGIAVAVGEMIGSGILRTPSLIAAEVGTAGLILALWAFGAIHASLQANVLAELGTMLPRVGGQYVFVRRAFGNATGLFVGWAMWGAHMAGLAASSIAFADFAAPLLPGIANHRAGLAVAVQIVLYGTNVAGLRAGRAMQMGTSLLKSALLLAFAAAAFWLTPNLTPPIDHHTATGVLAIAAAYQLIRGAYNGWHAPVYFAEENLTPARSIPAALFLGIVATGGLYLLVNIALLHALGPAGVAANALPYRMVLDRMAGGGASLLFAIGAMITVASCANANIMMAPRILFALSRDGLLPDALEAVNRGGSPYVAFLLSAIVSLALALSGGFVLAFGLIAILVTLASLITEIAFFALRRREPDLPRPYRAKLSPLLPALAIVLDAGLLALFAMADVRGAIIAAGLCVLCVPLAVMAKRLPTR
ncbi:MAG TPA: APC family permease [Rhizomicrobium sp.]|nr:APC family permease [Rhizomicrobium sp.]